MAMGTPRFTRVQVVMALLVVIAGAAAVAWQALKPEVDARPSLAVLPFENTGGAPESAYFTDGLHDSLIGQLSKVQGVRVISRTSVAAYKGKPVDVRQVARELGVAGLVKGSVQVTGRWFRVKIQLVDPANGTPVWSSEYGRALSDVFAVESDIVRDITAAVRVRPTLEEQARIARVPTHDFEAYDLYLRALEVDRQYAPSKPAVVAALGQLDQAVRRDPQFALAHALLSRLQMTLYWILGDYDPAELPVALSHAEAALRLAPDMAEPHMAMALYWYWGHRDYPRALEYLEAASAREPNNANAQYLRGTILLRFGKWSDALERLGEASGLDPRNERILQGYGVALSEAHRFAQAEDLMARLMGFAARPAFALNVRAINRLRWKDGSDDLEPLLAALRPEEDPFCLGPLARFNRFFLLHQFDDAAGAISSCAKDEVGMLHNVPEPKLRFSAMARYFAGDAGKAQQEAEAARTQLEARLKQRPDLPLTRMALAYMLAIEGQRGAALDEANRALADMPPSKDAVVAAELLDKAAALHAQLGEKDRALEELDRALRMPNGSYAEVVRRNPFWSTLKDEPRFRRLLDAPPAPAL